MVAGTAGRIGASCLGLLLLSCSGSNPVPRQPPPPQTHSVTIEGMRFQPEDLTVQAGDTIVWTNKDVFAHTATAAGRFDSRQIDANGGSWRYSPSAAGDVPYICDLHPTMKAMVRIKAAEPATRSKVQ
jgi:plastocyanin